MRETRGVGEASRTSIIPWNNWFHCMGHTYGTWLPGDPRGFRSRNHREHVEGDYKSPPPKGKYAQLHRHARSSMRRKAVYFTAEQRGVVVRLLADSLQRREVEVVIASIDSAHFHLLAKFSDRNPDHWIGVAKKESSHFAKEADLGIAAGFWAVRAKNQPVTDRRHQLAMVQYILDHRAKGGYLWFRDEILAPLPSI